MVGWRLWWRKVGLGLALATFGLVALSTGSARAEEQWVQTHLPGELWSSPGPDAISFGRVRQFSYFRLHSEQQGGRFYVYNPRSQNFAYVDAAVVGPSTPPPPEYLMRPRVLETVNLPGRIAGNGGLWSEPIDDPEVRVGDVYHNEPVWVRETIEGEDGDTWYRLDDGNYVWGGRVRLPAPVQARRGRWIDVSLRQPTIVTAYEGGAAVYSALAITGIGGWETPPGSYVIQGRVYNERMRGPGWDVPNVLFTQYFTGLGHAIHYNYWSSNWGYPGSKGCLGMTYADSLWFWNWATVGTPIVIHW
jgi:lipoprotein-anchoring transpeptidase ErfK/SrfK